MSQQQFSSPTPGTNVLLPAKRRRSSSTALFSLVLVLIVVLLVVFTPSEEATEQPEVEAAHVTTEEDPIGPHPLPCDGRGILILESVVVPEERDAEPKMNATVSKWSRSLNPVRYAEPGACPSLRAELDGDGVYPIFIDYGFNTGELCNAMRTHGGNARTVSDRPEYLSPC